MDGLSETSEVQSSAAKEEICTFHVKGHCTNGDKCPKLHRASQVPYQWQVKRNDQWRFFDDNLNNKLEEAFCDPVNDVIERIKVG